MAQICEDCRCVVRIMDITAFVASVSFIGALARSYCGLNAAACNEAVKAQLCADCP